jgi:hypothetical protein
MLDIGDPTNYFKWDGTTLQAGAMTISGTLSVGAAIVLGTAGAIYTTGKTSYADTDAGIWVGYDTSAYKLNIGTSTQYVKFDGTNMVLSDDIIVTSHITDDNVTRMWSSFVNLVNLPDASTWVTLASITLTPTDNDLIVIANVNWYGTGFNDVTDVAVADLRIYNGDTALGYQVWDVHTGYMKRSDGDTSSSASTTYTISSPGTSSITIYLKGLWVVETGGITDFDAYSIGLIVLERKK